MRLILPLRQLPQKTAALDKTNNNIKNGAVGFNKAILDRNKGLYAEETGLCAVAQGSKNYVRQLFGFSSPECKMVSKIKFRSLV